MRYSEKIAKNIERGTAKSRLARRITIISTAVCMVVMSIAMSIESGFRSTVNNRSQALFGNFAITEQDNMWSSGGYYFEGDSSIIPTIETIEGVEKAFEVIEIPAVARFNEINQGIIINGVNGSQFSNTLSPYTSKGSAVLRNDQQRVVISQSLAFTLGVEVGQDIEFMVFDEGFPQKTTLTVGGIFSTSMGEIEIPIVFAPINSARELINFDGEQPISSYRVLGTPDLMIVSDMVGSLGYEVSPPSLNASALADWLGMLQGNVELVLIIMIAVALINIASCALIVVLENTSKMGVLRTLGMRSSKIEAIFVGRLARMVVIGSIIGWTIGSSFTLIQRKFNVIKLDSKAYFVESLPMDFTFIAMIEVFLLSLLIVVATVWMVVRIVSRTDIAKSIKYE